MGSSVIAALRRRGIRVVTHNSLESVILPIQEDQWEVYYQSLKDDDFRRVPADLIQGKRPDPVSLNAISECGGDGPVRKMRIGAKHRIWPVEITRAIRLRFHLGKEQTLAWVRSLGSGVYWVASKLFVLNAKRDIVTNLERVLRFYFAQRVPMFQS